MARGSAASAGDDDAVTGDAPAQAPPSVQLRLPRMARYKVPEIAYRFAGSLVMRLNSEDDVKLAEALDLGARGTVTFNVEGRAPLELAFRVAEVGGGFVKPAGQDEQVRGRRRIVIGDGAVEDDEGED